MQITAIPSLLFSVCYSATTILCGVYCEQLLSAPVEQWRWKLQVYGKHIARIGIVVTRLSKLCIYTTRSSTRSLYTTSNNTRSSGNTNMYEHAGSHNSCIRSRTLTWTHGSRMHPRASQVESKIGVSKCWKCNEQMLSDTQTTNVCLIMLSTLCFPGRSAHYIPYEWQTDWQMDD